MWMELEDKMSQNMGIAISVNLTKLAFGARSN